MRKVGALAGLVALVGASVLLAPTSRATDGEVSPQEDNPPGCVTATSEDTPQCGAQGRAHFNADTHIPPITACADKVSPTTGSRITRVLPDGPRNADGSLAFISGVCVYLPPGYDTSGLRYPVVYLLHGGGGDEADWVSQGGIQKMLDDEYAKDHSHAAIAVMPDGRSGFWFDSYDRTMRIETYVLDHVVPYIDAHFRTLADRRGRAIAGLSNGGYGAMHLAAKRPDLFVAAGTMSGNLGARAMGGLGTPIGDTGQQSQEMGATYYGSVPIELASNLDRVDIVDDSGEYCVSDPSTCPLVAVDAAFAYDNAAFLKKLADVGHVGTVDRAQEPQEGAHAWTWWTRWLRDHQLPFFYARLARPQATPLTPSALPASFRYRTIKDRFTIYGYDVTARRSVKEFLDLTDVTASSITARGSGTLEVVTAPRYQPDRKYFVDGAIVKADHAGRLRVTIDLGPSHTDEQYSPAERATEAAMGDGYWTTKTVKIAPR